MQHVRSLEGEHRFSFPGWRIVFGAALGLAFSPGPIIFGSAGLLVPQIRESYGWPAWQIMLALTVFSLAGAAAAPATGAALDRYGVRRVLFPSILFLITGLLLLGFAVHSVLALYLLAAVWGALTVGTQSISYAKLIAGWFTTHRGLAIGLAAAGLGLGYSLVPQLVNYLLAVGTWRSALAGLAALTLIPCIVNFFLAHPNSNAGQSGSRALEGVSLVEARKSVLFWRLAGSIFLAAVALTGVIPNIAPYVTDSGFSRGEAATIASTFGIATILGRVVVGSLADRWPVSNVAILFFALAAVGFILAASMAGSASFPVLLMIALMIGLGFGAESDVIALFITRYFGQLHFASIYGYLLATFVLGASLGPALFGISRDFFGGYAPVMVVAATFMVGACLLLVGLANRHHPARKPLEGNLAL